MAAELFDRGWNVIGTVRDATARTLLHDLADRSDGRVSVERLDINEPTQLAPLHERLAPRTLDVLFVNAGTTNNEPTPIGAVPTADFVDVMVTNALSPMRVIEALEDLVSPTGLIGAMSSGQGSITNNTTASREVYRGSKAALNMFLRGFSVRQVQQHGNGAHSSSWRLAGSAPPWGDRTRHSPSTRASRGWWTFCCRGWGSPVSRIWIASVRPSHGEPHPGRGHCGHRSVHPVGDSSPFDRQPGQFDSRVDIELGEDVLHVGVDGVHGRIEPVGDRSVGETVHDEPDQFPLGFGQGPHPGGRSCGGAGRRCAHQ